MAGSMGKPVGVKRFVSGERVSLKPEAGRQVCPVCDRMTFRSRTLGEAVRWFRFDDTALYVEHRCPGLLRATPPAGLPVTRRVSVDSARSRLADALGPIVASASSSPRTLVPVEVPSQPSAEQRSMVMAQPVVPLHPVDTETVTTMQMADASAVVPPWCPAVTLAGPIAARRPETVAVAPPKLVGQVDADLSTLPDEAVVQSTLQGRIDAGAPGDTIDIEPGTYRESLTLRQHLTLRATGDGVVIAPPDGPAIALRGCGLTLEGITLRPVTGDGIVVRPGEQSRSMPIVSLTDCRVEAPARAIFAMIPAVTVRLIHCALSSATGSGLTLQTDSSVRAEQSTISTRRGRGILADDRAILQLGGTAIERCGGDGIRVGRESIVWMDRDEPVEIRANAGHGLVLGPGSSATLRGTVITTNAGWGVQAPSSQLTITDVVNSANSYGALDRAGGPSLTGDWVSAPRPVAVEAAAEPEFGSTPLGERGTEAAPLSIGPTHDGTPDESVAKAVTPHPEGRRTGAEPARDDDLPALTHHVECPVAQPIAHEPATAQSLDLIQPSRARADDLLVHLVMIDGIETVRLKDPRFRWLVRQLPPSTGLATLLVDALEAAVTFPIVPDRTVDLLDQLLDYVSWLTTLTLADELQSIVAPLTKDTMTPAILARLGWEGAAPVTLQEASDIANVTRERVRQVQNRLEQVLGEGTVWAPVLDRALEALVSIAPARPDRASDHLNRLGLIGQPAFAVEGIVEAQRILGRTTGLRLVERSGFAVLTTGADGGEDVLGEYEEIQVATQKRVNNQGIATLDEIRRHLAGQGREVSTDAIADVIELGDDYRVVSGDHVVPLSWDTRNPLRNRLAKMICLAPGLSPETAAWQLGRDDRRGYPAIPRTLRIFVEAHPDLELRDDRIFSTDGIDEGRVLSDSERTLVALFRDHGPELSFTELVPLAVGPTFTRVTLALRLASSPMIVKLARNRYRLLTATDRPDEGLALVDDDVAAILDHSSTVDEFGAAGPEGTEAGGDSVDGVARDVSDEDAPESDDEPEPEPEPGSGATANTDLPALEMAPGIEVSIQLPDPGVSPIHQVVADLFAGRLRWPEETRRQRGSATRLPDLLEAIYHGLPLGPLVVQPRVVTGLDSPARTGTSALVIVDGQQRLGWLARLFNPYYRVPGQPQLAPVRVAFQPDLARFTLAGPDSAADPLLIADIGPLLQLHDDVSIRRVTNAYLTRLRTLRTIDEGTADRLAAAITAVAALRDAHLAIQPVAERLHPDAISHLYDRLHRN